MDVITDTDRHLHVAVDRSDRTWRVLEREDGTFCVYYSEAGDPPETKRIVWDTADIWTDPPRVLLARAEKAEGLARVFRGAILDALAITEDKQVTIGLREALKEAR
jgi:hypothetical protein